MKVVFFNRFFYPDTSATSQILTDLAFNLAERGKNVSIVTSRVPDGELSQETIRDITVHRVADSIPDPHGITRRARSYLDFYAGARKAAARIVEPGDIIVVKTDPPLLSAVIGPLAKARGAKVVLWLQDLFPEIAQEYGIPGVAGVTGAILRRVRNRSIAAADCTVAISEGMAERVLKSQATSRERLHVVHNWADGKLIKPIDHNANTLRAMWGLSNKFVVVYSGNLGRVHEFETILGAAKSLLPNARIQFVFIGRGPRLDEVRFLSKREGLTNVCFKGHQGRELLSQTLGVADAHLCVLRPEFEGLVHPSKLYGIMAAGRPTIFVGDTLGETSCLLSQLGVGVSISTGDSAGLASAIVGLMKDESSRRKMGERAREAFSARYDMPIALARWLALLASLEDSNAS